MKIIYDATLMKSMILFENLTNVKVKDVYLRNNSYWFVVDSGMMFKAVGKNGVKIKKMENLFKKKVKVIEKSDDIKRFASNLIYPIKTEKIEFDDNILTISAGDIRTKGLLIGRERRNLKELKEILSRYFKFDDVIIR